MLITLFSARLRCAEPYGRILIIKPFGLIRLHEKGQRSNAVKTFKNEPFALS